MRTKPHLERLGRLLNNRVVRRVLAAHPDAVALLLVGDLVDGQVQLQPRAVWDAAGKVLDDPSQDGPGQDWLWLLEDLRPEFALLAQVNPVDLFAPYVLRLIEVDVRLDVDIPQGESTR